MAVYRYQVVSVGMWRGKVKRWNTTIHYPVTGSEASIRQIFQKCGYKVAGDVVGACSGGVASIAVYPGAGGAPIANTVYFDWKTPSTWIPYTGEVWVGIPAGTPPDASGESAVTVEGNMSALSKSGKPVKTRKFLHAIPSRSAAGYTAPDLDAATVALIAAQFVPSVMRNPAGVTPATVTVDDWYGNHQRVRGRRKPKAQVAANSFSAGVVVGAGAPGAGVAPFQ